MSSFANLFGQDFILKLGGHSTGVLFSGLFTGLLFYFFGEAIASEIMKRKWLFPLLGGFAGAGFYVFFIWK